MGGEEATVEDATGRPLDVDRMAARLELGDLEGAEAVRSLYTPDEWRWAMKRLATRRAARDDGVSERYHEMMYDIVARRGHGHGAIDTAA